VGLGFTGTVYTLNISNNTAASSTITGALVVKGGAGIGGALYAGNLAVVGNSVVQGATQSYGKFYSLDISFPSQASGVATGGGLGLFQPTTSTQAVGVHQVTASTPNGAFVTAIVSIKYGAGSANTGTITTIASSNMSLSWYAATANTISATQTTGVAATVTMSSMQLN
jgi:hypothetical protein